MSTSFEIPLQPWPQTFSVDILSVTYRMETRWLEADNAGWALNIFDRNLAPIALGLPLVTGANILDGLDYLGIGAVLYMLTDGDPTQPPTVSSLGVTSHLMMDVP